MSARDEWRWTDERGVQRLVGIDELRAAIAGKVLPPSTLVWRDGMTDWVPASTLPELVGDGATKKDAKPHAASTGRGAPPPPKPSSPLDRRSTLVGLPSPEAAVPAPAGASKPIHVPPREPMEHRPPTTQVPPAGRPADKPPAQVTLVPRSSRVKPEAPKPPPKRKLTTSEIDQLWSTTTHSDEDKTLPRKRPGALDTQEDKPKAPPPSPQEEAAADAQARARAAAAQADVLARARALDARGDAADPKPAPDTSARAPAKVAPVAVPPKRPPPPPPRRAPKPEERPPLPPDPPRADTLPGVPPFSIERSADGTVQVKPIEPTKQAPIAPKPPPPPPRKPEQIDASSVVAEAATETPPVEVVSAKAYSKPPEPPPSQETAFPLMRQSRPPADATAEAEPVIPPPPRTPTALQHSARPVPDDKPSDAPPSNAPSRSSQPPSMDVPAAPTFGAPPSEASIASPSSPPRARIGPRSLSATIPVPLSSLVGAGGILIAMAIAGFFAGRLSSTPPVATARPSLRAVPMLARAAIPAPPKACWVTKQPAMWAPKVSKSIPFDVTTSPQGAFVVAYARDAKEAIVIEVDPKSGAVSEKTTRKGDKDLERVIPTPSGDLKVTTEGSSLKSAIEVAAASPFVIGVDGGSIVAAGDGAPVRLWSLKGDDGLGSPSVLNAGAKGFGLTFRRSGSVWGGWIDEQHKASGELVKVMGSGGGVGKPAIGSNKREVAVIFADKPEGSSTWEIRVGRAPLGAIPKSTTVFPLPKGGPGGDAFAPAIEGLPDGRWILLWTEGASGSRAVRAQTLGSDFAPLGDPLALSPPAGNYGQGIVGEANGYAAAVFLSKGASSYELWGVILRCNE